MQARSNISAAGQSNVTANAQIRPAACRKFGGNGDAQRTKGISVNISAQNALMRNGSASTTNVRMDKVQLVQAALKSGTYHIDVSKVADKLMESLLAR